MVHMRHLRVNYFPESALASVGDRPGTLALNELRAFSAATMGVLYLTWQPRMCATDEFPRLRDLPFFFFFSPRQPKMIPTIGVN